MAKTAVIVGRGLPGSTLKNGTSRSEGRVIGPACSNRPDRPSLRTGTAVPTLTVKEGRDGHDHRRSCARVTGGVDTHLDVHVAAALDPLGPARHGVVRATPLVTRRCSPGSRASARSERSAWKEPALMGPASRGSYDTKASRSSRSIGLIEQRGAARASPIPSTPSRRRGPHLAGGREPSQDTRRRSRSDPGAPRRQALGPPGPGEGPRPDAPPCHHRP